MCPPLRPTQAAALSAAFLRDITENIALAARTRADRTAASPMRRRAPEALFDGMLAAGTGLVLADGSPPMPPDVQGFGRCLLHAAQAHARGGLRRRLPAEFRQPHLADRIADPGGSALLAPGERVVLGPAEDGGYYLLGMKQPHAHLFADIAWSTSECRGGDAGEGAALGLDVVTLPRGTTSMMRQRWAVSSRARIRATPRRPPTHGSNAADCADA